MTKQTTTSLKLPRGLRYNPYDHADALGITVIHRPIRTANGMWLHDHNLIVLKTGMRVLHDRTTLAHELAHATLGHRGSTPKNELAADRYAGELLVDPREVEQTISGVSDLPSLALELQVSERVLRAWFERRTGLAQPFVA